MPNAALVNFAAGETSPKSRGRFDIASYNSSCRKMENFIAEVTGAARYRNGFKHLAETWRGQEARLVPFMSGDDQAYMLEFTLGKMRVFKNGELLTVARTTITGITQANPAVITVTATTDLANGDEVIITGIVGMTELNGRVVRLSGASGSTFQLVDSTTGANINSTGFGAYVSGGTLREVYILPTPYVLDGDIDYIFFSQTVGTMYLTHYGYSPRKLTVGTSDDFTLAVYSRTNDPFTPAATTEGIIGFDAATGPTGTYALFTSGTVISEAVLYTLAVSGTSMWDGLNQVVVKFDYISTGGGVDRYRLVDPRTLGNVAPLGTLEDVTGKASAVPELLDAPIAVAFYENRLWFAGTDLRPRTVFGSRSPVPTTGASRFDDFTGGTDADHACFFSLAPVNGAVDYVAWAGGTTKYLLIGAFGGPFRVSGGGLDEPITPSSINVRQLDSYGCAATMPALNGSLAYYIQRGGKTVRGIKYTADVDDFASYDLCLNAEQIGDSELKRVVFQAGRPDALWVVRDDGQLCGCTIHGAERITGWHRHKIGGTAAKILDVAVLPRPGLNDQIYVVTERTVGGVTRRAVEAMADEIAFPDIEDYFTGEANGATDAATYRAAVEALLLTSVHLDAYETYNSTPATLIQGLHHLEGETVSAVADGELVEDLVVANGAVTLPTAASVVHVGLPYDGYLQTQNLEMGGRSGPAQDKPRNICAFNIRFLNSLGGEYGTDLYHMQSITDGLLDLNDGAAAPVFSGILRLQYSDNWSTETERNEKTVFIAQRRPFPCVVQFIDLEYATGDE